MFPIDKNPKRFRPTVNAKTRPALATLNFFPKMAAQNERLRSAGGADGITANDLREMGIRIEMGITKRRSLDEITIFRTERFGALRRFMIRFAILSLSFRTIFFSVIFFIPLEI